MIKYKFNSVLILLSTILLSSFVFYSVDHKIKYDKAPPGTIEIDSFFFIDYTEVRNLDYLEFMYWTKVVYGLNSAKYKSILPAVDLWMEEDSCLQYLSDSIYLLHPAYRDYPVVGVSQKQARIYCKWRSDRVFEYILVKNKIIEYELIQDSSNFFTVSKFFKGEYVKNPHSIISVYPAYRLPTELEWKKAVDFFSEYNKSIKCKSKYCDLHITKDSLIVQYNIKPCKGDSVVYFPMKPVACNGRKRIGTNLKGNVSEWLDKDNLIIGGSWKGTRLQEFDWPRYADKPTCNIGFRAVCEWKEFKKN